jgi:hypothetical protein
MTGFSRISLGLKPLAIYKNKNYLDLILKVQRARRVAQKKRMAETTLFF